VILGVYRSPKVTENSAIRQTAYEFLLAFHSKYVPILHRFWDIAIWCPLWGDLFGISWRILASEN